MKDGKYELNEIGCTHCNSYLQECICKDWFNKLKYLYTGERIGLEVFYRILHEQQITRLKINVFLN